MNDLDILRAALAKPAPSDDIVDHGRRELQALIRHQPRARARRAGWRLAGLGLTAAAAAGAVAVAAVVTTSAAPPAARRAHPHYAAAGRRPAVVKLSAQQVLLTAAVGAAQVPAGSGRYWYVRTLATWGDGSTLTLAESWSKRDGQTWIRNQKSGGKVIQLPPPPPGTPVLGPFFLGGREMTVSQIEHLPTDPSALTRWIVANAALHSSKTGGPAPSKAVEREDIFESLDSLLSQLPSPPQVRAAAFRALAALPGVTSLGAVNGGQEVQYTTRGGEKATLVIDPSTGQIVDTNFFVADDGSTYFQSTVNATITGKWTNTLP